MQIIRTVAVGLAAVLILAGCAGTPAASTGTSNAAPIGELKVLTPTTGDVVESATVTFAGTAPEGSTVVHDVALGFDDEVDAGDGTWTLDVELEEGVNEITLRLGDDEATERTIRVTYRPTTAAATTEPEPTDAPEPTAEPTPEPTPDPTPKPTKVEYKKLSDRTWAKVVKAPDKYIGNTYQVWACITQFDAATGPDSFRGQGSNKKREYWFTDGENTYFSGDEAGLADFVSDDVVVMNVVSLGSYSYDTQAGGNTTAPWFQVVKITRKGSCD